MKIFLFAFLVLIGSLLQSQTQTDTIFLNLKNGAILIRLKMNTKTIEYLKKNNATLAEKYINNRKQEQDEIVKAFSYFTYCKVYYFYDYDTKQIVNRNFQGYLMDSNLNKVEAIPYLKNNYLISEFSETRGDTIHLDGQKQSMDQFGETIEKKDTSYVFYNGYATNALVLYTPDMTMVQRPFPRYAKKNWVMIPRTYAEMVTMLQLKIEEFMVSRYYPQNPR